MTRPITRLAPLAAALVLSGCAGLTTLQNASKPTDLYQLTPKSTFGDAMPVIDGQLVIEEPTAASGINTDRIAVKPNPYLVQYLSDARWVDRVPLLVQTLIVESFENSGKVGAVGRQAIGLTADYTLFTDLREFQVELSERRPDALDVNVHLNIKIVQEPQGVIIASQSFRRRVPSASRETIDVVSAFDDALGQTMRDAVTWAIETIDAEEG